MSSCTGRRSTDAMSFRRLHSAVVAAGSIVFAAAVSISAAAALDSTAPTMVQVPAPAKPVVPPTSRCRFLMPTVGGRYAWHVALDARGRVLEQTAQWVDSFIGNPQAPVTLSVEWRSRDNMFSLPRGMANFYLHGNQENDYPLQLRFLRADGTVALSVEAGPAYGKPNNASAYVRVGELLKALGEAGDLQLEVQRGSPGKTVTTLSTPWSTGPFRDAVASYPAGRRWLERAAAAPAVFCTPN